MLSRFASALSFVALVSAPAAAQRLPTTVTPSHYDLSFAVDLAHARFEGTETIAVDLAEPATTVVLNAFQIDFHDVTIRAGGAGQRATVALDPQAQTATFTVPRPIARGPAEIHVTYTGRLNDELRGFYLSKGKGRNYAVTQFESTDARRAFPSFDEPVYKATFAVKVTADRGDTVIANGRMLSDTPGPGPSQHTMTFATTPKMSSYLVAMAVGDFQCLDGGADGIPIRICSTPDKKELGRIALQSAEHILSFYDRYYAIKYPFGKLDVVAVPDFAAGAMENTAAIFYRESDLLADSEGASVATRKNIASVLAHEMAHMWFGDLVTMRWWDDVWLNEGFATWMANHPLASWKPDWNIPVDEELENQTALNLDSLAATRPIHAAVETPGQIEEAFDAIAYQKGAAVLRMIESYVGADTFRAGVNAYLKAHAWGNATSQDFWTAIAQASGKPVDAIMPTFVNQPGVPLLRAALSCAGGKSEITLTQQRFSLDPSHAATSGDTWRIPVCATIGGAGGRVCDVMTGPTMTLTLPTSTCAPWAFANAGGQGYYRTAYPPETLRAMAPHVETSLSAPERLSLVEDAWALMRAGEQQASDYLTLVSGFGREPSSGVLGTVTARLGFIHQYLTDDTTRPRFEAFVRTLLRPSFDALGFAAGSQDSDDRRSLRAVVILALGSLGQDRDVVGQSRAALDRALAGGTPLDPTLAGAIVNVAASHGDEKLYDELAAAADRAASPDEHYRYLYALTDFEQPALIDRSLDYALSPKLRSQDTALFLASLLGHPAARARTWAFTKAHWEALAPKITIALGDVNFVSGLGAFCDAGARDDIQSFFAARTLPAATRTLKQTVERIDNCTGLRERQRATVAGWLK